MSDTALAPASEVLLRHRDALTPGLLLVAPAADEFVATLVRDGKAPAAVVALRRSVADRLGDTTRVALGFDRLDADAEFPGAIVYLPREKPLAAWVLRQTASRVIEGGLIRVVGENRAGGRSGCRFLEPWCTDVSKVDSARRCSLFAGTCATRPPHEGTREVLESFEIELDDGPLRLATLPGVFAAGRLDVGTAVLLRAIAELPDAIGGQVLDFGCGCGVLAAAIARRNPGAAVTLLDDFVLACEASRATLAANGLTGEVIASNGYGAVEGRFDWIVSNPPFHQGAATDYAVAEALVARAPEFLRPGGSLLIVANRFLDYAERMRATFGAVETLADAEGFRVYRARAAG